MRVWCSGNTSPFQGEDRRFKSGHPLKNMKFSIVVPCYNEEKNISSLLESIKELDYPQNDFEVIIVDNNCTDKTVEIATSYEFPRIVKEGKQGLTFARQRGFLSAKGEIILALDADCRLKKDSLKIIEKYFDSNSKIIAVSGPYEYADINFIFRKISLFFQIIFYPLVPKLLQLFFRKPAVLIIGGNTAIRKNILEEMGGYDTSVKFWGEDALMAFKLAKYGKVIFSPKLKVSTSGRRFKKEGYLKTIIRYFLNYFWLYFFNKPFVREK